MAYVFEPEILLQVAREALVQKLEIEDLVATVIKELGRRYPRHINASPKWFFNNAGGAMGAMCVLHASLTEYVIIFGTPVGTEGHSGRFFTDDYFMILAGEQWAFRAGQFSRDLSRRQVAVLGLARRQHPRGDVARRCGHRRVHGLCDG